MKRLHLLFLLLIPFFAQSFTPEEIARWKQQAQGITIIRDNWGVPHIYGKTDADAVFGLLYAQCEDDFLRVEYNYLDAIGRLAEVEGESALYHDLRARMFLDSTQAIAIYQQSPAWMKKLLDAFADGMNYFLYTHPEVKPRLLHRFQPWMPLTFSEGSIGGNITVVSLRGLQDFYEKDPATSLLEEDHPLNEEPVGSNGFAIAPAKSATGNALFLINPHTSFYFRSEVHMVSEKGLNAYGAVTWGQFFVYQGFNENCGWMHTSSAADSMDEYLETIVRKDGRLYYQYGDEQRPVQTEKVSLPYLDGEKISQKEFIIYRTHHGPIVRAAGDKWVAMRMMNEPLQALSQSYLRTKAKGYASFNKTMKIRTNSSNNTVYADRQGTIAYWHGNFMPKRREDFAWSEPVDGSNPATEWQGLHKVRETLQFRNPASGWIQNCNSSPFTAAGDTGPKAEDYPEYMAPDGENFRGVNAARVLSSIPVFTLDKLIEAANDPHLAGFVSLIPALTKAYEQVAAQYPELQEPIALLREWDLGYGESSVAAALAVVWGEKLTALTRTRQPEGYRFNYLTFTDLMIEKTSAEEKVKLLQETVHELTRDFGSWQTPWGEINRFQRLTGQVQETYDDSKPSIPVGFTSSQWGSLAAYGARTFDTKKRYGTRGNSFVAVVEFGPRLKARTVVSGGSSSDPASPHFMDQAEMFCKGQFKEIPFYREDVEQKAEKVYRPGE